LGFKTTHKVTMKTLVSPPLQQSTQQYHQQQWRTATSKFMNERTLKTWFESIDGGDSRATSTRINAI